MENLLKNFIISSKIESLRDVVQFYKNKPFYYFENDILSKHERVKMAEDKLNNFIKDVKEYRRHHNFELLEISKQEKANYIRLFAIEEREKARDFNENPYIVIPSLKRCINALRELVSIYPELNVYSFHWLSSRTTIKLQ